MLKSVRNFVALAALLASNVVGSANETIYITDTEWLEVGSNPGQHLDKRQPGGIYICTDINFGGQCGYAKQPFDSCIVLTSPWLDTISSFGPDSGNAAVLYSNTKCSGSSTTIFYPGSTDLRGIGWNDRVGSFRVREVSVISGDQCINSVDPSRFPGVDCNRCCGGCDRSGTDCCPPSNAC